MDRSTETAPEDCPFCAIAQNEDPSVEILCEERMWVAFVPRAPATLGHTLVIPRLHTQDMWTAPAEVRVDLVSAAARLGGAIQRATKCEGMNLITSAGEAAEQTVLHLHLHLVPRWRTDDFGPIWPASRPLPAADLRETIAKIRAECASL